MGSEKRILDHLIYLYGGEESHRILPDLQAIIDQYSRKIAAIPHRQSGKSHNLAQKGAVLITYGDQLQDEDFPPLQSLQAFLEANLFTEIESVHILPFYPYSSDDGFSVIDFRKVDPKLGSWDDIKTLSQVYELMFDAVVNHISSQSRWFKGFLHGEQPYKDYFITVDPKTDLSLVVRPRTSPLLTPFETAEGIKHVWTTFSADQIDLNFSNPKVLLELIDLLLFYVEHGAQIIRLDAIAFIWKEIGTPCIHLPQAHRIVKLFRAVIDVVAPWVTLITETNVPHEENISYFGDPLPIQDNGSYEIIGDQAHLVYQFPLAPLVLHTFHSGDASILTDWASGLTLPYTQTAYFNFIASHDGIGIRPAEGLLNENQIQSLVERTKAHGGRISSRTKPDGSTSVYELNITLYDALNDPNNPQPEIDVNRFIASQAIMLSLAGVPGIYIHSLFGSRNCHACVAETGRSRSINRQKFQRSEIQELLSNPNNHKSQVFSRMQQLLQIWRQQPAFNPNSPQKVMDLHKQIFSLLRMTPDSSQMILCMVNVSNQPITFDLTLAELRITDDNPFIDLISNQVFEPFMGNLPLQLRSYQPLWLTSKVT
ncbi:MAG: sugar phosphorylase [Anaerolineales bacterium]|nr:sugar phosphorylase [Anaerolineales bacterium]